MTDLKFEAALQRHQQIVDQHDAGQQSQEESLQVLDEGVGLARHCGRYLDDAEKRIELLTRDESGALKTTPFDLADEERA